MKRQMDRNETEKGYTEIYGLIFTLQLRVHPWDQTLEQQSVLLTWAAQQANRSMWRITEHAPDWKSLIQTAFISGVFKGCIYELCVRMQARTLAAAWRPGSRLWTPPDAWWPGTGPPAQSWAPAAPHLEIRAPGWHCWSVSPCSLRTDPAEEDDMN